MTRSEARGRALAGDGSGGTSFVRVPYVDVCCTLGAEPHDEPHIALPADWLGPGRYVAVRQHGESMVGAGILAGDTVVFRRQRRAADGDIVLVASDGGLVLRRLRRVGRRRELVPADPACATLIMTGDAALVGVAHLVIRGVPR